MADKARRSRMRTAPAAASAVQRSRRSRARHREGDAHSESRVRVLNGARRLFAEYGFEATSIRHIANELKMVSASLYHHFLTKEEMLHAIVRKPLLELVERALDIASQPTDAEHRLVELIMLRIQASVQDWEAHEIVSNETQFFRQREEFGYVQEAKAQGYHALELVLQDGVNAKLFRPELDVYFTIRTISRILASAARWVRSGEVYSVKKPTSNTIERIAGLNIEFILRAIRVEARISAPIPRAMPIAPPIGRTMDKELTVGNG